MLESADKSRDNVMSRLFKGTRLHVIEDFAAWKAQSIFPESGITIFPF